MKTIYRFILFVLAASLFTACSSGAGASSSSTATPIPPQTQVDNPYAPQPTDSAMMRGDVTIDSASLSLTKSLPPQVILNFAYFQPTPCFQLRAEISQPDAQSRIDVSAYAVAEKDKACALMALSTPLPASLNLGSFAKGHYSLWLNGTKVSEFDS